MTHYHCQSILLLLMTSCITNVAVAAELRSLFPLQAYTQNVTYWFPENSPSYNQPLVSAELQQRALANLLAQYFGGMPTDASPWEERYVQTHLQPSGAGSIALYIKRKLDDFDNAYRQKDIINYGSNYRPHGIQWLDTIRNNIQLVQFNKLHFQPEQRGITITDTSVRVLPTFDPSFYSDTIAGEGYPFDNLQETHLHLATPIYSLGYTLDGLWTFILTPDVLGWVPSNSIAYTDKAFIHKWRQAAHHKMAAIIDDNVSLAGSKLSRIYKQGSIGSLFPQLDDQHVLIPVVNDQQQAVVAVAKVHPGKIHSLPFTATYRNFSSLIKRRLGKPYGWGGLYGHNDCSSELKNLMLPFGFWLPTHSSQQPSQGKIIELSDQKPEDRLKFLASRGRPFMTLIHIKGHIMLYVGNTAEGHPLTFQNIWGLSPADRSRRAIIGEAVLFPLLLSYPEDKSLASLAAGAQFQISYLDQPTYLDELSTKENGIHPMRVGNSKL
ncbi:SH3 domain-containing protein [Yersinia bercovieri]|uniref:Hydrolase n=2 Tax=Yersinia bercovieri TaxID=634 RepID=A0A2G4U176_YERBE|nr:SH3 domain-containing C40 family peptidase [Yersinia bercovieri]MCB5304035.1 SH3 domain-containing protein [Yersinia bercovieri]PHZ27085.1 hydrolase [Yersinia bercovieri]QKJ06321.1 SH3 domain-containing protein [Yersinia bercovieri ATCC 43970]